MFTKRPVSISSPAKLEVFSHSTGPESHWEPIGETKNGTSQPISPSLVMAGADLKKRSASNLWPNQLEAGTADGIETKVDSWRNNCF